MKEIIDNWVKCNFDFFEKNEIRVEINSSSDNGNYDVYVFSREGQVAGIELYENRTGAFMSSDDKSEIHFKDSIELPKVFNLIKEYFIRK